jgi:hypothetical protein
VFLGSLVLELLSGGLQDLCWLFQMVADGPMEEQTSDSQSLVHFDWPTQAEQAAVDPILCQWLWHQQEPKNGQTALESHF